MPPSPSSLINRALGSYVRFERWVFAVLILLAFSSGSVLLWKFYYGNTILIPTTGGTYIEGSVGELQPLNPWFTVTNDVNRDVVSLVFAGLLKYDPQTKSIVEDLATYQVSGDGKVYTVQLKEHLFWHDSTEESPHPVTAADVAFTYETIQDPAFPNSLLRQNFQGVTIEQINERMVQFRLDQPYSFFPSNLTIGLLPKKSFQNVPVRMLDQTLDFGFAPIGAGPYKFKSVVQTDLSTEITLERFAREIPPVYRLDRIIFRIFSDYRSLLADLRNLDGIRLAPQTDEGKSVLPNSFTARKYTLPQYVSLFFNLDRAILKDQKLRLGLQLGTNKQEIADRLGEAMIVDTPLLQIDTSDWRYKFDAAAAQGALFESAWYFPEKIRLQRLLEQREANDVGPVKTDAVVFLQTGAALIIEGVTPGLPPGARINGISLQAGESGSGSWRVALPTASATGSLKPGQNLIRLTGGDGAPIDTFYVWRATDAIQFQRASEEQRLLTLFIGSRDGKIAEEDRISVGDMYLDSGFLRRRTQNDPLGFRINDAGQRLTLKLLTSNSPPSHKKVAEIVRDQWAQLGVEVIIEIPETRSAFEDKLLRREYDVLLFGQSLLDNLDSYPYWHSSGTQKLTGNRADLRIDAYNLSQYASFEADSLLETIRGTTTDDERTRSLTRLRTIMSTDVPAVFLYSPLYTFAHREDILGVELGNLSLHSDRFLTLHRWYVKQDRVFEAGKGWLSFFEWMSRLFSQEEAPKPV